MQTFEGLIEETGGLGRFQVFIMVMVEISVFNAGWSMLQMSFSGLVPDFHCHISHEDNSTFMNETLNVCSINGTTCSSHEFVGSAVTIITEWDLVCDRKWVKATVTSIQMSGVLVGGLAAGQSSDLFGRKKTLFFFVFGHVIGNLVAAFSVSWAMFAAARFMIGTCAGAMLVLGLPFEMEFLPLQWRSLIVVVPTWNLSVSLLAATAYVYHNWFHLHIGCAIFGVPSLFVIFFVPESIRWLAVHGKIEEAEAVFERMARMNKRLLPVETKEVLINIMSTEHKARANGRRYTYIDIFKSWYLAKTTAMLWFVFFSFATVFYGISFGVSSLGGSIYLNIFMLTMVELPLTVSTLYFSNRFGRRPTAMAFISMSCLTSTGLLLSELFAPEEIHTPASIGLSLTTDMFVVAAWATIATLMGESYPTVTRNLGIGLVATGSRVGGIVSPYLINLDDRAAASYGVMVGLLFTCTLVVTLFKETKGQMLADSVNMENIVEEPSDEKEMSNIAVISSQNL